MLMSMCPSVMRTINMIPSGLYHYTICTENLWRKYVCSVTFLPCSAFEREIAWISWLENSCWKLQQQSEITLDDCHKNWLYNTSVGKHYNNDSVKFMKENIIQCMYEHKV